MRVQAMEKSTRNFLASLSPLHVEIWLADLLCWQDVIIYADDTIGEFASMRNDRILFNAAATILFTLFECFYHPKCGVCQSWRTGCRSQYAGPKITDNAKINSISFRNCCSACGHYLCKNELEWFCRSRSENQRIKSRLYLRDFTTLPKYTDNAV